MKHNKINLLSILTAPLLLSATTQAALVTQVIVSDGTSLTTLSTSATDPTYTSGASALLQSITAGGTTYTQFIGSTYVGDVEGVLYALGGTAVTDPSIATGDLDLATGVLDPYGTGTFIGTEYWAFSGETITDSTVFVAFNNGTPSGGFALVDSSGADITDFIGHAAFGGETLLNNFSFSRTNGGDLATRDVAGVSINVSDFTFTGANTAADVVGIRGSGTSFDGHDLLIASVPEPSSTALLGLGGLALILRRRK